MSDAPLSSNEQLVRDHLRMVVQDWDSRVKFGVDSSYGSPLVCSAKTVAAIREWLAPETAYGRPSVGSASCSRTGRPRTTASSSAATAGGRSRKGDE